jgi:hypothetical protein
MGTSASSIDEHSPPLYQSSTEASEPQLSPSPPRQSKSDEKHTLIMMNRFKYVHTKIHDWLKRVIAYMMEQP